MLKSPAEIRVEEDARIEKEYQIGKHVNRDKLRNEQDMKHHVKSELSNTKLQLENAT